MCASSSRVRGAVGVGRAMTTGGGSSGGAGAVSFRMGEGTAVTMLAMLVDVVG